jgi:ABC-type polysaccharide/polyol phosphate export permease
MGKSDGQIVKEFSGKKGKGCAVVACIVASGFLLLLAGSVTTAANVMCVHIRDISQIYCYPITAARSAQK